LLCGYDLFTVEALGLTGTVRCMVFFVIVVKTRTVEIAGIATNPTGKWMEQMARNLTDARKVKDASSNARRKLCATLTSESWAQNYPRMQLGPGISARPSM
jgi:hypothetical protein